jgi:NAD-dependent SIR2 family protein deacetylase
MSKIVFVLGAGASAHSGTPLMGDFLEVAERLWRSGEVNEAGEHFEKIFNAIGKLQGIHSKAKLDTYNIETIYAAFEMGKLLGRLPGIDDSGQIDELINSIKKVIGYTLEKTTKLPHGNEEGMQSPVWYWRFANIIANLLKEQKSCSIMTFNYDLGLDYSLTKRQLLVDYALGDINEKKRSIVCLKLHGSLNWARCGKCGKIKPNRQFQITETKAGLNYSIIPMISNLKKGSCCGQSLEEDPFIVPPTWNKTRFHAEIGAVWQKAASELKDAENIFVLGYSLPSTDLFFHYLFALGVDMKTILKKFYVYNTDKTGVVEERFNNLLGSGVIQRFKYIQTQFEDAVTSSRHVKEFNL